MIEEKAHVQKKIGGARPAFSRIEKQPTYKKNGGSYYSLLMGREFKPNQFAVLRGFDNKVEGESRNGLDLIKLLSLNQYKAPKQKTPYGGLHSILHVDAEQAEHIGSRTGIT